MNKAKVVFVTILKSFEEKLLFDVFIMLSKLIFEVYLFNTQNLEKFIFEPSHLK